jgi:hypothetical protein
MAATALLIALCGCTPPPTVFDQAVLVYRCPRGYDGTSTPHNIDVWRTPDGRLYFRDSEYAPRSMYSSQNGSEYVPLSPGLAPEAACLDVHGY